MRKPPIEIICAFAVARARLDNMDYDDYDDMAAEALWILATELANAYAEGNPMLDYNAFLAALGE